MRLKIGLAFLFALIICFGTFQNCSPEMMAQIHSNGASGEAYEGRQPGTDPAQIIYPDQPGGGMGQGPPSYALNCSSSDSSVFGIQTVGAKVSIGGFLSSFEIDSEKGEISFSKLPEEDNNSFATRSPLPYENQLWHTDFFPDSSKLVLTIKENSGATQLLEFNCQ